MGAPETSRVITIFAVTVAPEAAHSFDAAISWGMPGPGGQDRVPFTFPLRWLAQPEIRAAIAGVIGTQSGAAQRAPDTVPVHVEQHIEYDRALRVGESYQLAVGVDGPDAQNLVCVTGVITDAGGAPVARLTTTLLLVDLAQGDAP